MVQRGGASGQARGFRVDRMDLVLEVVFGKHDAGAAEGVGADDVGTGLQIGVVDVAQHVRPCQVQMFVAALVVGASEVVCGEGQVLQVGAHGAVENQDAFLQ